MTEAILTSVNWGVKPSSWRGGISVPKVMDLPSSWVGVVGRATAAPGRAVAGIPSPAVPPALTRASPGAAGAAGWGKCLPGAFGKTKGEIMPWHRTRLCRVGTPSVLFEGWFNSRNMLNPDGCCKRHQLQTVGTQAAFHTQISGAYTPSKSADLIYWVKRLHASWCVLLFIFSLVM